MLQLVSYSNSFNYGDFTIFTGTLKSYFYMLIFLMFKWDLEMQCSKFKSCLRVTMLVVGPTLVMKSGSGPCSYRICSLLSLAGNYIVSTVNYAASLIYKEAQSFPVFGIFVSPTQGSSFLTLKYLGNQNND